MKAIILSICPEASLVDITHNVEKFDVRMGAFVLASASAYFEKGAIHVAVVDPGVGTKRRPILVETESAYFLGPDNGVLLLAALKEGVLHAYNLSNRDLMLPKISKTFHGRDIFAPAAAYLACGRDPYEFGPQIQDWITPSFTRPSVRVNKVFGEILHVDDFGNVITNVSEEQLVEAGIQALQKLQVEVKGKTYLFKRLHAYGDAEKNEPLTLLGSHDFMEISVNQGRASDLFTAKAGDAVVFSNPH